MRKQAEALERARDAEARELARLDAAQRLVAPLQPSLVGAGETPDDVEQRRLSGAAGADGADGAVGSDDADDLVLGDGRRDIRQRREPAEADGDPLHLEQRSHARRPPSTAVASETIGGALTGKSRLFGGVWAGADGAPGRDRTCDQPLRRRLLYPLSYGRLAPLRSGGTDES